jgi:hypothetical protein
MSDLIIHPHFKYYLRVSNILFLYKIEMIIQVKLNVLIMSNLLNVHGFMEGMYGISIYIVTVFTSISYELYNALYNLVRFGSVSESNFVCVMLSISILVSIIDDMMDHMQYDQLDVQQKRIQSLEKRVYLAENKLDDTRSIVSTLQSDLDYYIHSKERMRLG